MDRDVIDPAMALSRKTDLKKKKKNPILIVIFAFHTCHRTPRQNPESKMGQTAAPKGKIKQATAAWQTI